MGRIDLADVEGILSPLRSMELADAVTPATSVDLGEKPGCCSTCGYPCEPAKREMSVNILS